jgi:adenylate cyclase
VVERLDGAFAVLVDIRPPRRHREQIFGDGFGAVRRAAGGTGPRTGRPPRRAKCWRPTRINEGRPGRCASASAYIGEVVAAHRLPRRKEYTVIGDTVNFACGSKR